MTTSFTIKGFPLELYRQFKAKCATKGWSVKQGLINLITEFLEG